MFKYTGTQKYLKEMGFIENIDKSVLYFHSGGISIDFYKHSKEIILYFSNNFIKEQERGLLWFYDMIKHGFIKRCD